MTKTDLTEVNFHGATLIAQKGETPADTMVAMRPVVEGMGLDWEGQRIKMNRHPVLKTCTFVTKAQVPGDDQVRDVTFLPLSRVNFWLATLHPDRIKDKAVRAKVIEYQTECADALFAYFFPGNVSEDSDLALRTNGISKMVAHKVTGIEKMLTIMARSLEEQDKRINSLVATSDPRLAVAVDHVSVLDVLEEWKVPPAKRNTINKRLGFAFRSRAALEGVTCRKDGRGVWLFPRDVADRWMKEFGGSMVSYHVDSVVIGQQTMDLIPGAHHPHTPRVAPPSPFDPVDDDGNRLTPTNRYLVRFDGRGNARYMPVGVDACVITPSNEVNLRTFLRECIPPAMLPVAWDVISRRYAYYMQYGPNGAGAPVDLKGVTVG